MPRGANSWKASNAPQNEGPFGKRCSYETLERVARFWKAEFRPDADIHMSLSRARGVDHNGGS